MERSDLTTTPDRKVSRLISEAPGDDTSKDFLKNLGRSATLMGLLTTLAACNAPDGNKGVSSAAPSTVKPEAAMVDAGAITDASTEAGMDAGKIEGKESSEAMWKQAEVLLTEADKQAALQLFSSNDTPAQLKEKINDPKNLAQYIYYLEAIRGQKNPLQTSDFKETDAMGVAAGRFVLLPGSKNNEGRWMKNEQPMPGNMDIQANGSPALLVFTYRDGNDGKRLSASDLPRMYRVALQGNIDNAVPLFAQPGGRPENNLQSALQIYFGKEAGIQVIPYIAHQDGKTPAEKGYTAVHLWVEPQGAAQNSNIQPGTESVSIVPFVDGKQKLEGRAGIVHLQSKRK